MSGTSTNSFLLRLLSWATLSSICISLVPNVLYETDRVLAINKPPGIAHHNDIDSGELGILNLIRDHYRCNGRNQSDLRLYGVHRLDRVTSGVLLFAKDQGMARILTAAFRDNRVVKYYVGISNRQAKSKKQGWVKGELVRGRRKSWYLKHQHQDGTSKSNNGASNDSSNFSVTRFFAAGLGELDQYRLQAECRLDKETKPRTCLLFRPHTGKTHQLRVAAKSLGLPLLGDPVYGEVPSSCSRTCLHAAAVHVPLEGSGHESITIWCPPPFVELFWKATAKDPFDSILANLVQKHCESPDVLSAMTRKQSLSSR